MMLMRVATMMLLVLLLAYEYLEVPEVVHVDLVGLSQPDVAHRLGGNPGVVQAFGHRSSPPRIKDSNSERKDFSFLLLNYSLSKQGTYNTFSEKIGRSPSLLIPHIEMSSILADQ
jgi:hypothetical protein